MPFGVKPLCSSCQISHSAIWRKGTSGEVLCNSCGLKQASGVSLSNSKTDTSSTNGSSKNGSQSANSANSLGGPGMPALRKSSRIKPSKKALPQTAAKSLSTKGKGRRFIFKKTPPTKSPASVATFVTGDSVFHKSQYYQVGDVVSLVDHEGGVYYAHLRGFLSDQFNEKSAVITWLLPTIHSPRDKFDPNTFILGPEEDLPRKMDYMEFVCHAPSDYFRARDAPYKTLNPEPNLCYIWTSINSKVTVTPTIDEIFGTVPDAPMSPLPEKSAVKSRLERERVNREITKMKEKSRAERRLKLDSGEV